MVPRVAVWAVTGAAGTGVGTALGAAAGAWPQAASRSAAVRPPHSSSGLIEPAMAVDRRDMLRSLPRGGFGRAIQAGRLPRLPNPRTKRWRDQSWPARY